MAEQPRITAIIPTLNEKQALPRTLTRLREAGLEVMVVDGGSSDGTVETARSMGVRVLTGKPGRACQMNLGAAQSREDILFFLHADSLPPMDARDLIWAALEQPGTAAGAFHLKLDSGDPRLGIISRLANFRSRCLGLPYGDQGLFLRRAVFEDLGGFLDIPLMEDVDIIRRLRKTGRVVMAPSFMLTSARRWEQKGVLTNTLGNQWRLIRYFLGCPPEKLAPGYRDVR
jgi:rSAM/selenodomain-associated transferase 2